MHSSILRWAKLGVAMLACACLGAARAEAPFSLHESSVNADKSDWLGLDEDQVFFRMLRHQGDGHDWTIKIGKGGQIYSIRTPGLGELIAPQRAEHGQWVDEVFQHTLPMPPQKDKAKTSSVVDGDIHQAGYYTKSDLDRQVQIRPRSVYSPLFWYRYDALGPSVSYVTWPQHAHLPRRYAENLLLMAQRITDLGGGVVEIEVEISKWGGARNESVSLPWAAFRTATLPVQILGQPDGGYRVATQRLRDGGRDALRRLREGDTGGWVAVAAEDGPKAQGVGVVFGRTARALDGKRGFVRWGSYGSPGQTQQGGTVITVKRDVGLEIGEALRSRYFLVLGTLAEIQAKAATLESQVLLEKVRRTLGNAGAMPICADDRQGLNSTCDPGQAVVFRAYRDFVAGARPLFLLRRSGTPDLLLTDDPYEISFDPTDGSTLYLDLLGWALPEALVSHVCGRQTLADSVASVRPAVAIGRNAAGLRVLSVSSPDCPSAVGAAPGLP